MSINTKVIASGTVQDVAEREGVSAKTGEVWRRRELLIFQPGGCVAQVAFRGTDVASAPPLGSNVQMLVEVGVYRDDDVLDFVRHLTEPQVAK